MRRRWIPGLINIFEVSDPEEIKALSNDPVIDRNFNLRTCPFNWFLLKRSLLVLSFNGRPFPTMSPRGCSSRARRQEELSSLLDLQIHAIKQGTHSLDHLVDWIKGVRPSEEVGILTQQLLGGVFCADFVATEKSWEAALILVAAPRSSNFPKMFWWFVTGKIRRAKRLLAGMVSDDLSAVNAIGIAVHNIVKGLHQMRSLYLDKDCRERLSPEVAAAECLRAPVSVYRQSTQSGSISGQPFEKNSLFVMNIGTASQLDGGKSLVFMQESWSGCPASAWVPALFEGLWRRTNSR